MPSIYIEARMRCSMEQLWALMQQPELPQQWDLRFTEIEYLPRAAEAESQRFLRTTRIGFGLGMAGRGEIFGTLPRRPVGFSPAGHSRGIS